MTEKQQLVYEYIKKLAPPKHLIVWLTKKVQNHSIEILKEKIKLLDIVRRK